MAEWSRREGPVEIGVETRTVGRGPISLGGSGPLGSLRDGHEPRDFQGVRVAGAGAHVGEALGARRGRVGAEPKRTTFG